MELLERDADLARLEDHFQQTAAGRGRVVFLAGEAGVGKTSLTDAFCRRIGDQATVLRASCDALSTPGPLSPLRDLAPAISIHLDRYPSDHDGRDRLFRDVLDALVSASQPSVVVAEDAHWADGATVELLRFLARRIGERSLLIIVTYRDDEIGSDHPLRLLLGDLATASTVHRLALLPLSEAAVQHMAAGCERDFAALHRLTGGNPFFLTEVLAYEGDGVPATVGDAVLARATRLSPEARAVLDVAAVIGSPIDPALLQRIAGPSLDATDECLGRGLLQGADESLAFRHELVRQAILSSIAPHRRRLLHTRVLAAMREANSTEYDLASLAHHAEAAGDRDAVLEFAIAAAKEAASLHAHREAAAQYARALRFTADNADDQREPLLVGWRREAFLTGQMPDAISAAEALLDIARRAGDRVKQAESLTLLGSAMVYAGRNSDAEDASRTALALIDTEPPGSAHAAAFQLQASLRMLNRDLREAIVWGERAMAAAERVGDREIHARALNTIGSARLLTGEEAGMAELKRSWVLARDTGWDEGVAAALSNLGSALGEIYRFGTAAAFLQEGIAFARERDLDTSYNVSWLALVRAFQGQWAEAIELAGTVAGNPAAMAISRTMALVALGRVRARRGDPEAWITLDAALELALPTGTLQRLAPVRAARAEAAWLAGDLRRTREEARAALDLALHHRHPWHSGELIYWLSQAGERHEPQPFTALPYDRQISGDWEAAAAAWRELGCPYEEACALAASDDPTLIRQALAAFEVLGATPAAAQAMRRLRNLGVRDLPVMRRGPRASTQANPAGLTMREAEVLALLADGLRNAEIADRLYLSPNTVRRHVSVILAKLGVETRIEAARAAMQIGIITP